MDLYRIPTSTRPGGLPWDPRGNCEEPDPEGELPTYADAASEALALEHELSPGARTARLPAHGPRFLVVAHQTAESSELRERLVALSGREPRPEFVLLVPATPVAQLEAWSGGGSTEVALKQALGAADRLRDSGVRVAQAVVGDASPLRAIEEELREHPGYAGLVICTLPAGVSRWLGMDLPRRARRRFGLQVIHVVAESVHAMAVS